MAQIELIKEEPSSGDFIPLEEHQSQTPGTFFGGKPVLHYHCIGAEILVAKDQLDAHTAISGLISSEANGTASSSDIAPSHSAAATGIVDVWVTSEKLILFNPATKMGASIPYPTITLHATRQIESSTESIYMQLELSNLDLANDEEDYSTIELDIVPISTTNPDATDSAMNGDGASTESPTKLMYNAIVACTDLHPDPDEDEAPEDMPALGSGGWITSENMADFVDKDGNFTGFGSSLGAGAGTRRPREDGEEEGDFEDAEDNGRPTEGDDGKDREDAKWQRTE